MTHLKTTIGDILSSNGFVYLLSFSEQVDKHRDLLVGFVVGWGIVNLVSAYRLSLILIWLLCLLGAILFEQLCQWFVVLAKKVRGRIAIPLSIAFRQSLFRRIDQRLNLWLVAAYILSKYFLLSPQILSLLPPVLQVASFVVLFCEIAFTLPFFMSPVIYRSPVMFVANLLIQTTIEMKRSRDQILKVFNTGFRIAIPGIALAFVVGFISQELWQLISGLSWLRIGAVALLVLIFIVIPSTGLLKQVVTNRISRVSFQADAYQGKSIRQAILRLSPTAIDDQTLDIAAFQAYDEQTSWKWKYDLYMRSKATVTYEMLKRAVVQLWSSVVLFFPTVLLLILAISIVVFPRSVLQKWIDTPAAPTSILAVDENLEEWWAEIIEDPGALFSDPLLKYALICALILVGQFAVSYSMDRDRVFSGLEKQSTEIQDLMLLTGAYYALQEEEFQFISSAFEFGVKASPGYLAPISTVIVPEKANRAWVRRVISRFPDEMPMFSKDYISVILVRRDMFGESDLMELIRANHPDSDTMPPIGAIDLPEINTWVWISPKFGGPALTEYRSFQDGKRHIEQAMASTYSRRLPNR